MTQRTAWLVAITVVFALAAVLLPAMPQSLGYHDFSDERSVFGVTHFFDVASNAAFLLAGVTGLVIVARRRTVFAHDVERWPYAVLFFGLLLTSLGSSYYHLAPDNGRLFWDRLPMTVAFMGLVASQIVDRVNVRAGIVLLIPLLGLGAASVIYWDTTERVGNGNVLPYALLQGYVMVVLLLIAILYPSRYTRARGLYYIFAWYLLSKVLESFDDEIFDIGHLISGHTLKHFAAAGSGFTACWMLAGRAIAPPRPERPKPRVFHWLYRALVNFARVVLLGWTALAIYYSNLPWGWARIALALTFLAFAAWVFWVARRRRAYWALAGVFAAIFAWWSLIPASHDRPWRPEVAVMPRAIVDGDRVRFTGVRNFEFRSRTDFTPRYEEREVSLSHLTGVDFYVSYWSEGVVGHTFLSFLFDNAPPLSVSIETRPEVGEGFDPLASMFKQFELIYVVGDERDIVGLRTDHRDEEVFLYHTVISPEFARRLFMVYAKRINQLADRPEFYHLLSNSCTINIVRYANAAGRAGSFDFRHLLNGLIDRYLYAAGVVDTSLPFDELRRRSRITQTAQRAGDGPDFPARIRDGLPMPTAASPSGPRDSTALTAHTWSLVSATDAGNAPVAALQPRPGMPVELEFADGHLLARGGCNPLRVAYSVDARGSLVVDRIVTTQMACDPPLMRIDTALVDFFASPVRIDVTGGVAPRLRLQSATSSTLEFVGRPTPESRYGPATIAFLEIAPAQVACSHPRLATTRCLQVRDVSFDAQGLRAGPPGEWRLLYEPIDGFDHVEGIRSVLRVKRFVRTPAAADTPATLYFADLVVESETAK